MAKQKVNPERREKMRKKREEMAADPQLRALTGKRPEDIKSPEDIERDENQAMSVDPRTGRLPFGLYDKPQDDPYDPRFRGTQTEEGMAHVGALPEEEREYLHLGPPGTRPSGIPLPPRQPAPPLSQPPIAKPSVPSGPPVRVPRGGGAPRQSVPGGIGSLGPERIPVRPIAPTLRPDSPWRYKKGGSVSFASGGGSDYGQDYRKK